MSDESPEPLLSADETAALLSAVQGGSALDVGGPETRPSDLGAPDAPMRRAIAKTDECAPRVGASLREAFLRMTTLTLEVRENPCEIVPNDLSLSAFDESAAIWDLTRIRPNAAPTHPREAPPTIVIGAVAMSPGLCHFVLEKRLGASDAMLVQQRPATVQKPLSPLDRRVLEPLAKAIAEGFFEEFEGSVETIGLQARKKPENEATARFSPTLRLAFKATLPNGSAEDVAVTLTGAAFIPLAGKKDSLGRTEKERFAAAIGTVPVELTALLGMTSLSVRELLALEVGNVVRLDGSPERPVAVRVDGVGLLSGMPLVQEGNLAVEVKEGISISAKAARVADQAVVEQAAKELLSKLEKLEKNDRQEGKNHDRRAA